MARRHWLFKSEPDVYGFAHLLAEPDRTTLWDGVRNYQARNLLRDEVQVGDLVLFYHSQSDPPHVAGVCEVVRAGYPDPTQFDPASKYHDEKATPAAPRWFVVDVRAVAPLMRPVALAELKADPRLEGLLVIRKGQRLSVM
ncbi:MAG: EVE domain-containing protein, partial [Myxococcales bacterium]|nr:EVE domain-containing protein [Myxococcales bacterium]